VAGGAGVLHQPDDGFGVEIPTHPAEEVEHGPAHRRGQRLATAAGGCVRRSLGPAGHDGPGTVSMGPV
jgi:hypothetical protein